MPEFSFFQILQKLTQCAEKIKTGSHCHPFSESDERLDSPATRIEGHQRHGDNDRTDVQLAPFAGNQTTNHQSREADHDACYDVTGQHDEYRRNQTRHRINKISKVDFATLLSISRPTYISAGAVAYPGTR